MRVVFSSVRFSSPTQRISLRLVTAPAKQGDRCPLTAVNGSVLVVRAQRRVREHGSGLPDGEGDGVKTMRERVEEKRAETLERVREQVQSGSLVIHEMTDEERRRYRPVAAPPQRSGRR